MNRAICAGLLMTAAAWAQDVVAVKAGLVHHVEGDVYLDDAKLEQMKPEQLFAKPPQMKDGALLRTVDGRAEVLLSPGIILRVDGGSVVKMLSNKLTDTRVELVRGSMVLEVMDRTKENIVALHYQDLVIVPRREGLYKVGGAIPELMVYDGQADIVSGKTRQSFKRGRAVLLQELAVVRKFNPSMGDGLVQWSIRRGEQLALASRSVVGSMLDQRRSWRSGGWFWNPAFGLFTFIPNHGQYCGYFGYCFYTPQAYYSAFVMPRVQFPSDNRSPSSDHSGYGSSGGYQTTSQRSYEPPPSVSAPSAPAPGVGATRGGEGAVGRGGEGGGRSQ